MTLFLLARMGKRTIMVVTIIVIIVFKHLTCPIIVRSASLIHEHLIGCRDCLELEGGTRHLPLPLPLRSIVIVVMWVKEETVRVVLQRCCPVCTPELCWSGQVIASQDRVGG
jgi:hypothetical protein